MIERWQDIRVPPGSLSDERLPGPLDPIDLGPRPETLAETFCAAGRRLGAEGTNLRPEAEISTLARLFLNEPAYLLAELLAFRAEDEEQLFSIALEDDPEGAVARVGALARRLRDWIARIRTQLPEAFSKQLQRLNVEGALEARLPGLAVPMTEGVMTAVQAVDAGRAPRAEAGPEDQIARLIRIEAQLRATHALLRNAVASLQPAAAVAFQTRITSGEIDPALGLLIAELQAGADVDAIINGFVARHMAFYYGEIIGQRPRPATRESVLLHLPPSARPTYLPEGSELRARADDGTEQRFVTAGPVSVSPAHVASTAVLVYDADPRISFNAALAGITDIRAALYPPGPRSVREGVFAASATAAVDMGLDICSPMLALAEGERWIELTLSMRRSSGLAAGSAPCAPDADPGEAADPEILLALRSDTELLRSFGLDTAETRLRAIAQEVARTARARAVTPSLALIYEVLAHYVLELQPLRVLLGRIVTLALVEGQPLPEGAYWQMLQSKIDACRDQLSGQSPAGRDDAGPSMIFETFARNPDGTLVFSLDDIFQKLLGDAFTVRLSTKGGPRAATWTKLLPHRAPDEGGMRIWLKLDASLPAVTAPEGAEAPVLSIRAADTVRICPASIFERYRVTALRFDVRAEGLRRVAAFSDTGPVATDQTFMPFGHRPGDGASFTVGCPELALKPVTAVGLALKWAELPDPIGGFAAHYRHYPQAEETPDPKVAVTYLGGDGWKTVTDAPVPLFHRVPVTGELVPDWRFEATIPGQAVPAAAPPASQDFQARQNMRAGAVRLTLSGTADGFHADRYPLALMAAMRPLRLPFVERKMPPAPYVPRSADLVLDYAASETVALNAPDSARPGTSVVQVSPFGRIEVFPSRLRREVTLLPPRLGHGHLFIELDGPHATGPLALLFEVAESGHLRLEPKPNPIAWFYLTQTGWTALPATAVLSDDTAGLMRSGLVMVDLPEDAAWDSPEMPGKGVWLAAVATGSELDIFPALSRVETNGLRVLRDDDGFGGQARRAWRFEPPQPGLGAMREVIAPVALRPPETERHFVARVAERLAHRKRAVTPRDMERMVLEEFPEVWMVKCLAHLSRATPRPAPGEVTLVAVRQASTLEDEGASGPQLFDVSSLRRMREFLLAHAPTFAQIEVVNPAFERLQVRARLAFDHFRDDGAMARRVNAEIGCYLNVWTAPPELARFGWSLNREALRARIESLDYVRGVSDFSVLHLAAHDDRTYALLDTAQEDERGAHGPTIRPLRPWGLPISVRDHALSTVSERAQEDPVQSGIGRLAIGDMFIVRQRTNS
ncbi:hypothetical protein [Rhodovulum steppense]|uniref:Baseplate J-like protein n=1 Tax=Rhodovulum steppense TaxID=540251 RepID=A0A4R1YXZ4_9RHOB|nr:hypothetical protein [Rhodovulum steppense]TCM86121.1 hypothetical protein EV216_10586 [Rhodovulum steppense]